MRRVLEQKGMANSWRLFVCLGYVFMVLTLITICLGITSIVFSYTIKNQDKENEIEV